MIPSPDVHLEMEVSMYFKLEIAKIVNANEVFEAMAIENSRYSDILDDSYVLSGSTFVDVLSKLIKMDVVVKSSPINDESNKKKAGYYISDNFSFFYYKYIFRFLSQMSVMDPNKFYELIIE